MKADNVIQELEERMKKCIPGSAGYIELEIAILATRGVARNIKRLRGLLLKLETVLTKKGP